MEHRPEQSSNREAVDTTASPARRIVTRFARDAAKDEALIAAVVKSPLAGLVSDGAFREQALPLVLGLGVIASVRVAVCLTAADIRNAKRAAQKVEAQRRSDSEASEPRPVLGELPPAGESLR